METILLDDISDPFTAPVQDLLDLMSRSYSALEKYVPLEVVEGLQKGKNPVSWELQRDQKIVVFADLIGFSTIIEKISNLKDMEMVMSSFYEIASDAITATDGKIVKLLGDGFMAHYELEQAEKTIQATFRILRELHNLRQNTQSPFLKFLYCGFGIAAGSLVKGNIGSNIRKDFTLLGDVVNSAARLESHTRKTEYALIFEQRFKNLLNDSEDGKKWDIIDLGKYKPKGKKSKLTIFTIDHQHFVFDRSPKDIAKGIDEISSTLQNEGDE